MGGGGVSGQRTEATLTGPRILTRSDAPAASFAGNSGDWPAQDLQRPQLLTLAGDNPDLGDLRHFEGVPSPHSLTLPTPAIGWLNTLPTMSKVPVSHLATPTPGGRRPASDL